MHDNRIFVLSKRDDPPRLYRYPGPLREGVVVTLERIQLSPRTELPLWPTDASLSPDGLSLAVWNGSEVREYHRDPGEAAERFFDPGRPSLRVMPGDGHWQGEAITYEGRAILITGECGVPQTPLPCRNPAPVYRVPCVDVPLTVSITRPAPSATVYGDVEILATADSSVPIEEVVFQVDREIVDRIVKPPYSTAWDARKATNGDHLLSATAYDRAGNQQTVSITVLVDRTPPTVVVSEPLSGKTVSGTVTVSAVADDGPRGSGVAGVQFYYDGDTSIGDEHTTLPYSVLWDTVAKAVPNGPHVLTAVARDRAGNQRRSAPVTVTVRNPERAAASDFYTLVPCRLLDTRQGSALTPEVGRDLQVTGRCGIPQGASAAAGNLTVVNPTQGGFLRISPAGFFPTTSTLNFRASQIRANNFIVELSWDGKLSLFCRHPFWNNRRDC